jgi:hypothetical protein
MTTTRTKPVPDSGHDDEDDEDDEDNAMKGRNVDTEGWARSFVRLARLAASGVQERKAEKFLGPRPSIWASNFGSVERWKAESSTSVGFPRDASRRLALANSRCPCGPVASVVPCQVLFPSVHAPCLGESLSVLLTTASPAASDFTGRTKLLPRLASSALITESEFQYPATGGMLWPDEPYRNQFGSENTLQIALQVPRPTKPRRTGL